MSKRLIYAEDAIDVLMKILDKPNHAEFLYTDEICEALDSVPSAQPDNRLERIADIVEGTIDHLDRDDAMDMLYQIKEVLK